MADRASQTIFVMSAGLPWPHDAHASDTLGALDDVALYQQGEPRPCAIRRIASGGAMIRLRDAPLSGAEVALELATGQRAAATVEWARGEEAAIRFRQPIDMVALLNRKLVAQTAERRRMPRVELRCHVGLRWGGSLAAATLRNISATGIQVEGDGLPATDTFVSIFIDGLVIPSGEVVWKQGRLAGIELMEELRWSSLMPWIRTQARG
ncbi:PilZ domain-containing protein [Sphingomonas sp. ASV193]|uniref:PilZ domain-containing protein n=1 Tax=Sphingomonas sp. ASV193 TaxID=3144405 RepID=UPI0032E8FE3A